MISKKPSPWLIPVGKHHPENQLSLFCFPPAGSGSLFFRNWPKILPDTINVWAVRLPGRESRVKEPLVTQWSDLIEPLVQEFSAHCQSPFALFGHSLGSLLSLEVAYQLGDRFGCFPEYLTVSGRNPPHTPCKHRDYKGSDEDLIEDLRADGGTPEGVLQEPELMSIILPIYRADLQLNEEYEYISRESLPCPILALVGDADEAVSLEELKEWEKYTRGEFKFESFPGGHMYLTEEEQRVAVIQSLVRFMQV
ncbi:thioesterase II family protein [Crocosphaera sp. Alani8]|uniref:thioesterase II family protein n=1 Tax=Crocosphaera sp. Alani8 TaxID=3038952 RepID=UPI00313ECA8D